MAGGILVGTVGAGKTTIAKSLAWATPRDILIIRALYNDRSSLRTLSQITFGHNVSNSLYMSAINDLLSVLETAEPVQLKRFVTNINKARSEVGLGLQQLKLKEKQNSFSKIAKIWALSSVVGSTAKAINTPESTAGIVTKSALLTTTFGKPVTKALKKVGAKNLWKAAKSTAKGGGYAILATEALSFIKNKVRDIILAKLIMDELDDDGDNQGSNAVTNSVADFFSEKKFGSLRLAYRETMLQDEFVTRTALKGATFFSTAVGFFVATTREVLFFTGDLCAGFHLLLDGGNNSLPTPFVTSHFFQDVYDQGCVRFEGKPHILSGEHGAPMVMQCFVDHDLSQSTMLRELVPEHNIDSIYDKLTVIDPCFYDSLNSDALSFSNTALLSKGLPSGVLKFVSRYCRTGTVLLFTESPKTVIPLTKDAIAPLSSGSIFRLFDKSTPRIDTSNYYINNTGQASSRCAYFSTVKGEERFAVGMVSFHTLVKLNGDLLVNTKNDKIFSATEACENINGLIEGFSGRRFEFRYDSDLDLILLCDLTTEDGRPLLTFDVCYGGACAQELDSCSLMYPDFESRFNKFFG